MKKTSYVAIHAFLTANGFSDADVLADLEKELNRGAEAKQAKENLYEQAKAVVLKAMDAPATITEIYDCVVKELPEGFTKGMLQHAIARLWKDEVVKTEGKVNTYARA